MNNNVINGEIIFKYPDDFKLMDSAELKKYFGTSDNMSGIRSEEQHIIMSFAWNKVNMLLSILADQKSILNGMEKRFRGRLKGFKRKENIDVNVCGVKAKGFAFEYIANDADIEQIGNIVSFKLGKILYVIQFTARKEDEQKAQNVFDKLIVSMTINEH